MVGTAFKAPLIAWVDPSDGDGSSSAFGNGIALADPRPFYGYQPGGTNTTAAFAIVSYTVAIDAAPSALAAANIAAAQVSVAATPLALVTTSGAGITVGTAPTSAATGMPVTALAIDGAATRSTSSVQIWQPSSLLSRNVRITSVGNDSAATFLVAGYDAYGFPMSEQITGANAGVAAGKKAFKYIASVTPAGTLSGSNVSVGTGDVYGFPLQVQQFAYVDIFWNGALITASTGFVTADQTTPATPTTGDVRGTYAVQSASDGTKKIQVFITPMVGATSSIAGLFGQAQA